MNNRQKESAILTALTLIFLIAIILGTIHEIRTCDGQLVRGLFWWECIVDFKK